MYLFAYKAIINAAFNYAQMTTYQVIEYIILNLITSASRVVAINYLPVAFSNRATVSFTSKLAFLSVQNQ